MKCLTQSRQERKVMKSKIDVIIQSSFREFVGKDDLVNGFEKSRPGSLVNVESGINDDLGELVFIHGGQGSIQAGNRRNQKASPKEVESRPISSQLCALRAF